MKFEVTVAYESVFEIESDNKEGAKDIALKSFFEEPEVAELQNLEVVDGN